MAKKLKQYDFSDILDIIKGGEKGRRESWKDKGSYIYIKKVKEEDVIFLHRSKGPDMIWKAHQVDVLAKDWVTVE